MSQKIHIGKNGPAPCHATKQGCKLEHYDSMEEAMTDYEEQMSSGTNVLKGLSRNNLFKDEESIMTVDSNGTKRWKNNNGDLHRVGGPAIEWGDGDKEWYQNGKLHRIDGPAEERANGNKYWCQNGKLHRTDGPAIERPYGTKEYWVDGVQFTEEDFNNRNYDETRTSPKDIADSDDYKQEIYYQRLSYILKKYGEGK